MAGEFRVKTGLLIGPSPSQPVVSIQNASTSIVSDASSILVTGQAIYDYIRPYATNASIGLAGFAQNASFNLYATNASVGLAIAPYATNASVNLQINQLDASIININASLNNTIDGLNVFVLDTSLGITFYWSGGYLEASTGGGGGGVSQAYVDGSLAKYIPNSSIGVSVLAYRTFGTAANNNTGDFVAYRTFGTAANNATGDFVAYRTFGTAANSATGDFLAAGGGTMTGNLVMNGGGLVGSNDYSRISMPGGASYINTSGSVTGAIKIALPAAVHNNNTMVRFTVVVYSYNTGVSYNYSIGGYNYSAGWVNVFAISQTDDAPTLAVRYGDDGTHDCVWIGEISTSWSYPQVYVTDVQCGFIGPGSGWASGWGISFVTSFDSVETSRTPALAINTNTIGSQTVATAGNLTGHSAGYAYADGGTASAANLINGNYTGGGGAQPPSYIPSGQIRFNMMNAPGNGGYYDFMMMDTYSGGDVPYVTALGIAKQSGSAQGILAVGAKAGSTWSYSTIITSANIGSQSVNYAATAGSAPANGGTSAAVTINYNNDSNSTYQVLWGSSTSVYGTAGIYCNPYTDYLYATNFQLTSDVSLKTKIIPIPLAPVKVEYKQFVMKNNPDQVRYGVIAQDLEKTNPELVSKGADGMLTVSYIDLLIKEIASLKARVEQLEKTK